MPVLHPVLKLDMMELSMPLEQVQRSSVAHGEERAVLRANNLLLIMHGTKVLLLYVLQEIMATAHHTTPLLTIMFLPWHPPGVQM